MGFFCISLPDFNTNNLRIEIEKASPGERFDPGGKGSSLNPATWRRGNIQIR